MRPNNIPITKLIKLDTKPIIRKLNSMTTKPTITSDIEKLHKEAAEKALEAERITRLLTSYPDLQKYVGRWEKIAYYSASVNSKVDKVDLRHNCGCCSDSLLEAWPYLETPDGNVYSDPPEFRVGEQHYLGGDKPYSGWKDELRKAGISEVIIGVIKEHFSKDKEERIAAASEDDSIEDENDENNGGVDKTESDELDLEAAYLLFGDS
jgi:hypothetical protein